MMKAIGVRGVALSEHPDQDQKPSHAFWIEDESGEKGLPIYEPLTLVHDDTPRVGDGFLPMIADALQRLTVA